MQRELTLGSLFDGIGGFCYAAYLTGRIKPVWASEIEPNCIDITRYRFPEVMHVGSVTELKGDEIQPVDIITFGSPCQDLSIAGKRKGLKGNRSGLFMEAIRIIEEMRSATNGKYPTFIIWENVPGAFSSGGGADFRAVLEKITKANIPMPASGEWADAGMVRGAAVDTAWRVLDSQHWGTPQRRKRIYLIGDFAGQRAGEILFKPESLLGYTPKGKEQKQETARQFADCVGTENSRTEKITGMDFSYRWDAVRAFTDKAPTLVQNMSRGGSQTPCIMYGETRKVYGLDAKDIIVNKERTGTLSMSCGSSTNRNLVAIEKKSVIPLRDEVTRNKASNSLGVGEVGGPCPTLTTADVHSVFYEAYQHSGYRENEISGTITANQAKMVTGSTPLVVRTDRKAFELNQHGGYREAEVNGALRATGGDCGGGSETIVTEKYRERENVHNKPKSIKDILKRTVQKVTYVIRRLTPVECERLQGYPDNWTKYGADGVEIADTARYRAIGNSICVYCAERVYLGILDALEEGQTNERME